MSSEIVVVLVIVALALVGLVFLEINSRRNRKSADEQEKSREHGEP